MKFTKFISAITLTLAPQRSICGLFMGTVPTNKQIKADIDNIEEAKTEEN